MFDDRSGALVLRLPEGELSLDMSKVRAAESQLHRVATVNSQTAPVYLALYNEGFAELCDHLAKLDWALAQARKAMNLRRSVVLLDEVPRILRERGLSTSRSPGGSEDQRQAVLDADAQYLAEQDRVEMVKAVRQLLLGKRDALENAFTSVKKVLGADSGGWRDYSVGRDRSSSAPSELPEQLESGMTYRAPQVEVQRTPARAAFGKSST